MEKQQGSKAQQDRHQQGEQLQARRQEGIRRKKELEEKAKELGVSISHLKKEIRKEKWEADKTIKRKQKRQHEKLKKKQKKAEEQIAKQGTQQEQNQNNHNNNEQPLIMKKRKQDYQEKMIDGLKVVIDLQFYDLMTEKEACSLVKQLSYCHSANRKSAQPFNYILTSTTGNIEDFIDKKYNGKKWGIKFIRQPVHEAFSVENIVYLTGDATEDIEQYEDDKIYVIGGIVDHNRLKKITYNYAVENKIVTKRLPLKNIKLKTNVHLAVNHVWEWMLKKYNGEDWDQALEHVLPERKIIKNLQEKSQQEK